MGGEQKGKTLQSAKAALEAKCSKLTEDLASLKATLEATTKAVRALVGRCVDAKRVQRAESASFGVQCSEFWVRVES